MTAMRTTTSAALAILLLPALGAAEPSAPAATREVRLAPAAARPSAPALSLAEPSGRTIDLRSLRGRAVVVNFWASWCAPCRFEIPELSAFYLAHRDGCFEMLGVAEDSGGPSDVARAASELGIEYPVLLDPGGEAARRFGVSGLPHTVVLDARGVVRRTFLGAIGRADLERTLAPLLAHAGASCPRA